MQLAAWTFGGAMVGALAGHTLDEICGGASGIFVVVMAALCGAFALGAG